MKLRNFNQDALENLFCCVRQCSGGSSDLTCTTFTAALKTCLVTRFSGVVKDKNCMDDDSFLLGDIKSLMTSPGDLSNNAVRTETLVRGDRPSPHGEVNISTNMSSSLLAMSFLSSLKTDCIECKEKIAKTRQSPTGWLSGFLMKCEGNFNRSWKNMIHKLNIVESVAATCDAPIISTSLFCEAHSFEMKNDFMENIAIFLISKRVEKINKQLKEKIVKRTRQAVNGSIKDADGLLEEEACIELPSSELMLLDEDLDMVPPKSGAFEFFYLCYGLVLGPIFWNVTSFIHGLMFFSYSVHFFSRVLIWFISLACFILCFWKIITPFLILTISHFIMDL